MVAGVLKFVNRGGLMAWKLKSGPKIAQWETAVPVVASGNSVTPLRLPKQLYIPVRLHVGQHDLQNEAIKWRCRWAILVVHAL